jgi:hypothetical protein
VGHEGLLALRAAGVQSVGVAGWLCGLGHPQQMAVTPPPPAPL